MQHVTSGVRWVLLISLIAWFVLELRHYRNTRPDARHSDRGSRAVLRLAAVVGFLAAIAIARTAHDTDIHPAAVADWAGVVVLWCGIGLRMWSIRTLGQFFTYTVQTSSSQPVVTAGPYRLLRHPSYTGMLLAVAGIGLVYANWLSLLVLAAAVFTGLRYRIAVEERALLAAIGEPYREFASSRKRLVPFVW